MHWMQRIHHPTARKQCIRNTTHASKRRVPLEPSRANSLTLGRSGSGVVGSVAVSASGTLLRCSISCAFSATCSISRGRSAKAALTASTACLRRSSNVIFRLNLPDRLNLSFDGRQSRMNVRRRGDWVAVSSVNGGNGGRLSAIYGAPPKSELLTERYTNEHHRYRFATNSLLTVGRAVCGNKIIGQRSGISGSSPNKTRPVVSITRGFTPMCCVIACTSRNARSSGQLCITRLHRHRHRSDQ